MSPIHPSRTVPLCSACLHRVPAGPSQTLSHCGHPRAPISPVSGEPADSCTRQRQGSAAASLAGNACGPSGAWFQPDVHAVRCPTCNGSGHYRPPFGREAGACPECRTHESAL